MQKDPNLRELLQCIQNNPKLREELECIRRDPRLREQLQIQYTIQKDQISKEQLQCLNLTKEQKDLMRSDDADKIFTLLQMNNECSFGNVIGSKRFPTFVRQYGKASKRKPSGNHCPGDVSLRSITAPTANSSKTTSTESGSQSLQIEGDNNSIYICEYCKPKTTSFPTSYGHKLHLVRDHCEHFFPDERKKATKAGTPEEDFKRICSSLFPKNFESGKCTLCQKNIKNYWMDPVYFKWHLITKHYDELRQQLKLESAKESKVNQVKAETKTSQDSDSAIPSSRGVECLCGILKTVQH